MSESDTGLKIFNDYIDEKHPGINKNTDAFKNYSSSAEYVLRHSNFIMFPVKMETNKSKDDTKNMRIFHCDLLVNDIYFWKWLKQYRIRFDSDILRTYDTLKAFLEKQVQTISINPDWKDGKELFRENLRIWLLAWYEAIFWLPVDNYVDYIGFEPDDKTHFIFSNGVLNIATWEFTQWNNILAQNPSIKISYSLDDVDKFTREESLKDIYSLKHYISPKNSISSIFVWQFIAWIFREEYKADHNEFPFLWIQSITGAGKTSLLNFMSWICWYDNDSIEWTWNTSYASLAGMNYTWKRYYFYDEFQQLTNGQLKTIQSAYNSWKSYKWWMGKNWREMGEFNKDCNLVCAGENISPDNQALLDRFTMLDCKERFLIVRNVKDVWEFGKYESLTWEKVNRDYLDTGMIKLLAKDYYRPRFMCILKHKLEIPYKEYHDKAAELIKEVVQGMDENIRPLPRIQDNLIPSILWYLMVCWDDVNEDEVREIIKDYFDNFMEFKRDAYVCWKVVNDIVDNISGYCSWISKVKWAEKGYPMIYLKHTEREQGLIMQIPNISKYAISKLGLTTDSTTVEQQLKDFIGIQGIKPRQIKVAKSLSNNMGWTFIPLGIVEKNDSLKRIWDVTLDYLWSLMDDLIKIRDDDKIVVTNPKALQWLISEICGTYASADFFDTETFSKEESPEDPF